jgi:hypothetical protein
MSGVSALLHLRKIAEADADELYYAVRDAVLKGIFAKAKKTASANLRSFLNDESTFVHGSDRGRRVTDEGLVLSFPDESLAPLAVHSAELILAANVKALEKLARAAGYAVVVAKHDLDHELALGPHVPYVSFGPPLRPVARWTRGAPTDGPVDFPGFERLSVGDKYRLRTAAMTGWCGCEVCEKLRLSRKIAEPDPRDTVPRAWDALAANPDGERLAFAAAAELGAARGWPQTAGLRVLADWLEERGISLPAVLLPGLARTYAGG